MTAVHMQGLLITHHGEVLHGEQVLCPVLKYRAIATIGDEFIRMLGNRGVKVVLDHEHDARCLL